MWRFISYGLDYWNLTHSAPDDAVRVWMLPYDFDVYDVVYLLVINEDDRLDFLSGMLEISSN